MMYQYCDNCGRFMKHPYAEIDYGLFWCKRCYNKKYGEDCDNDDMWGDDGRYNMNLED